MVRPWSTLHQVAARRNIEYMLTRIKNFLLILSKLRTDIRNNMMFKTTAYLHEIDQVKTISGCLKCPRNHKLAHVLVLPLT